MQHVLAVIILSHWSIETDFLKHIIIQNIQSWHPFSSMKTIHRPIKQQQSIPLSRPCNVYNIFFILERARIIQQFCAQDAPAIQSSSSSSINYFGYELLSLPDLPPRYCDLILPPDWFVPGKNAKRKHVATNGLRNFTSLARTVASNWRAIDEVTFSYCNSVAQLIKERHAELLSQACGGGGLQQKKQPKQEGKMTKAPSPTGAVSEEEELEELEELVELVEEEEEEERSPDRTPQFSENTITAADMLVRLSNIPAAVTPTSSAPRIFHENAVHQYYWNGQHGSMSTNDSNVTLEGERSSEQSAHDGIVQLENCHDLLLHQWLNDPLPLEEVTDVHDWLVKYGSDDNFEDFFAVDI